MINSNIIESALRNFHTNNNYQFVDIIGIHDETNTTLTAYYRVKDLKSNTIYKASSTIICLRNEKWNIIKVTIIDKNGAILLLWDNLLLTIN